VGDIVAIYTQIKGIGRSSIKINIEVWAQDPSYQLRRQVTHALFTYVAITDYGKSRPVPKPMVID
jgi:acyl-CoA thioesterase YciA